MEYRYFVDFQLGISVFATFSYGIVVLGIPQYPPHSNGYAALLRKRWLDTVVGKNIVYKQEKSLYHQLYNWKNQRFLVRPVYLTPKLCFYMISD